MTTVTALRSDGDWTVDDLRDLPDDGLQYELADGVLLVSPAPRTAHQRAVGRLFTALVAACPDELEVFVSPVDFQPTRRRSLQPDVLVVRREDVGEHAVERPLQLAVEVLSPSTRAKDLLVKRVLYEDSGVQSMWVVDLDEPSITGWVLREGAWADEHRAVGDQSFGPPSRTPSRWRRRRSCEGRAPRGRAARVRLAHTPGGVPWCR
jgi:Uma2 family endonuclease